MYQQPTSAYFMPQQQRYPNAAMFYPQGRGGQGPMMAPVQSGASIRRSLQPQVTESGEANVIADRYKTKMCRQYVASGTCSYYEKCMFAHGPDELRTKEMNLRDGLTTTEAIANYRRMLFYKRKYAALAPTAAGPTVPQQIRKGNAFYAPSTVASGEASSEYESDEHQDCTCDECGHQECVDKQVTIVSDGWYQYNPYGWSPIPVTCRQADEADEVVCTCGCNGTVPQQQHSVYSPTSQESSCSTCYGEGSCEQQCDCPECQQTFDAAAKPTTTAMNACP